MAQGGASALLATAASPGEPTGWRRRCLLVLASLVAAGDVEVLRSLLQGGVLMVTLDLMSGTRHSLPTQLVCLHILGALTWRCNSSALRHSLRPSLRDSAATSTLICAAAAFPDSTALRVGAVRLLSELSETGGGGERRRSAKEEERIRVGELTARDPTPATPAPRGGQALRTSAWKPAEEDLECEPAEKRAPIEMVAEVEDQNMPANLMAGAEVDAEAGAEASAAVEVEAVEVACRFLLTVIDEQRLSPLAGVEGAGAEGAGATGARACPDPAQVEHPLAGPRVLREAFALGVAEAAAAAEAAVEKEKEVAAAAAALLEGESVRLLADAPAA